MHKIIKYRVTIIFSLIAIIIYFLKIEIYSEDSFINSLGILPLDIRVRDYLTRRGDGNGNIKFRAKF